MKNYTIDLTKTDGYALTENDVIKEYLEENRLNTKEYLFTAINGDKLDEFLERGTYRKGNEIYAFSADEFVMSAENTEDFDLESAISPYMDPIVAIYKSKHFKPSDIPYEYEFIDPKKKPEAIHGLLKLIW